MVVSGTAEDPCAGSLKRMAFVGEKEARPSFCAWNWLLEEAVLLPLP
jgi:hypothetical protein